MSPRIKPSNSLFRSEEWRTRCETSGFAFLLVMMMAAVLLVALTVGLPSVYQEGQREREEELIFRGKQYARAILLFRQQFRRFPANVKELLQTNGIRFLRKAYPDPMTRKGKWRFIHANAAGVLLDSKLRPAPTASGGLPGTPAGAAPNPPAGGTSVTDSQQSAGTDSQQSSAFFGESQGIQGGSIVGVASTSHKESIRVWNKRTHYDEWEFLGVDVGMAGLPSAAPNPPLSPGQQTTPGPQPPQIPVMPPLTDQSPPQE